MLSMHIPGAQNTMQQAISKIYYVAVEGKAVGPLNDGELMQLFYLQFDNRNLLALMANAETEQLDERGCLSRENLLEIIQAVRQDDATPQNTPAYMKDYLQAVFADEEMQEGLPEDVLSAYYYEYAMKCGNAFFARWFQFNLNLNNILIALTARRFGFNASSYLVGNNEVAEALRTSGARDFGLSTELAYYDELARISEMTDPASSSGSASSRPVMNWELTSPGS